MSVPPTRDVSLIKYAKPQVVKGADKPNTFRFIQRANHEEQQNSTGNCGGVTDPVLLDLMQHACKEAALSQIDKEQILDAIVPPREWDEDGKHYKQLISKEPSQRSDVIQLNDLLNEQLTLRQARPDGICPIRRELANQCFNELIRQVTISQAERGLLLLRVRDELKMTRAAYQDLFVSSRDYDSRKTVGKDTMNIRKDFDHRLNEIAEAVKDLEIERDQLASQCEHSEQIFKEERDSAAKRHIEEFQFLKRVNNALKQQIDAMMDPENNFDPVIAAYEGVKGKQPRTSRRRKGCDNKLP